MYSMEQVVNLAKHRGFVFLVLKFTVVLQTLGITVLGIELKIMLKSLVEKFIQESPHNVGLDDYFNEPKTWIASGHVGNFNDPMIDCKNVKLVTVLTN